VWGDGEALLSIEAETLSKSRSRALCCGFLVDDIYLVRSSWSHGVRSALCVRPCVVPAVLRSRLCETAQVYFSFCEVLNLRNAAGGGRRSTRSAVNVGMLLLLDKRSYFFKVIRFGLGLALPCLARAAGVIYSMFMLDRTVLVY
jgi:hypothetical protein